MSNITSVTLFTHTQGPVELENASNIFLFEGELYARTMVRNISLPPDMMSCAMLRDGRVVYMSKSTMVTSFSAISMKAEGEEEDEDSDCELIEDLDEDSDCGWIEDLDDDSDCEWIEDLDEERERLSDALALAHIALGGDGEWKAKPGQVCRAGETGDLAIDVPALAGRLVNEHQLLSGKYERLSKDCESLKHIIEKHEVNNKTLRDGNEYLETRLKEERRMLAAAEEEIRALRSKRNVS